MWSILVGSRVHRRTSCNTVRRTALSSDFISWRHRHLRLEQLEDRRLLAVAPLNVALVSDAVVQARQIQEAASQDTIAIVYHADTTTIGGLVDILGSVSAAHNGAPINHLAIVAHGALGNLELGTGGNLRNVSRGLRQLRYEISVAR